MTEKISLPEFYVSAKFEDGQLKADRILLKQRGVYLPYVRERACYIVKTWKDSDYVDDWNYRCSECGGFIDVYERDLETGNVISAANFCSNCGAKVALV